MIYKCGHCGFIGYCYGTPTSQGVSAPFCSNCQMNDKLEEVENKFYKQPLSFDTKKRYMEKYFTYKQYTKGLDKETLTQEEFIALIQEDCYYCGKRKANGIAKINNDEKYVKRNCVPCCKQCSRTKNTLSQKDFEAWKDRFVNFQLRK